MKIKREAKNVDGVIRTNVESTEEPNICKKFAWPALSLALPPQVYNCYLHKLSCKRTGQYAGDHETDRVCGQRQ